MQQQFTGKQYLKIDIANNFGLDKKLWQERLDWFDQHEDRLEEMLQQADEPALYFAGVQAWRATQRGEATGYPISLDATASGMQILAALTGDRKAALLCNVVNNYVAGVPQRMDAYTAIYQAMLIMIGEAGRIKRDDCKDAVMTSLYGSKAVPKEVFGEGILLSCFENTMSENAPAVWELNQAFIDIWDSTATINSWVLPDNFHVHVKVMDRVMETVHFMNTPYETFRNVNQATEEGRSLGANTVHSIDGMIVREMSRRCNYNETAVHHLRNYIQALDEGYQVINCYDDDPSSEAVRTLWKHYEESGYLSARILDHLHLHNLHLVQREKITELLDSLPAKPFEVISVHDCFRCLPNYGNDLRKQYAHQLALIGKSKLLQFLLCQILHRNVTIGKLDDSLWREMGDAEYALS